MKENTVKQSIGIALLGLFGATLIYSLYGTLTSSLDLYEPKVHDWVYIFSCLIISTATFFTSNKLQVFTNKFGRIAALCVIVINFAYALDTILCIFTDVRIFSFLGDASSVILTIFNLIIISSYLFSLKTWIPIKIVGLSQYILSFIISFLFYLAWKKYQDTSSWEMYESFSALALTINYIALGLNIAVIVLIIGWLVKRTSGPYPKFNPLELI